MSRFLEIMCVVGLHLFAPLWLPFFGVYLLIKYINKKCQNRARYKLKPREQN